MLASASAGHCGPKTSSSVSFATTARRPLRLSQISGYYYGGFSVFIIDITRGLIKFRSTRTTPQRRTQCSRPELQKRRRQQIGRTGGRNGTHTQRVATHNTQILQNRCWMNLICQSFHVVVWLANGINLALLSATTSARAGCERINYLCCVYIIIIRPHNTHSQQRGFHVLIICKSHSFVHLHGKLIYLGCGN